MHRSPRRVRRSPPSHTILRLLAICILAVIHAAFVPSRADSAPDPAQPVTVESFAWSHADLRLLDAADAAAPELDLLAVYLRHNPRPSAGSSPRTHLRLDFLDLPIQGNSQILLALDFSSGGARWLPVSGYPALEWDALLVIPSGGPSLALDPHHQLISNMAIRILRDPQMDSLEISFDPSALYPAHPGTAPPELGVQVFIAPGDASQIADQSLPTSSFAPPPAPARYLLTFWNTYPATTPAQALRRWDGAHTGPLGGRHGLANLLRTAAAQHHPVFLLDLKTPAWLSALDYAGDLERVNYLAQQGTLILPEVLPPGCSPEIAEYTHHLAHRFNLPISQYGYTHTIEDLTSDYSLYFFPVRFASPLTYLYRQGDHRLLPFPFDLSDQPQLQPGLDGLSLDARHWMLQAALSASASNPTPIFVLGGDLTRSTWGNPQIARAAFDYLAGHPWMQPVDSYALLSMSPASAANLPPVFETATLPPVDSLADQLFTDLVKNPSSTITPLLEAAAQSYLELVPPSAPAGPGDAELASYLPYLRALQAAGAWAQNPQPRSSCDLDLDRDGQTECILASKRLFTVLEPANGSLVYAFASTGYIVHQLIASDFTTPGDLPAYQVQVSAGQVVFSQPQAGIVITYQVEGETLRIEYQPDAPIRLSIPLVLDPWLRYHPGWGEVYQGEYIPGGYAWQATPGTHVEIRTSARLQAYAFNDTQAAMNQVENPNQELPPGHYLPFPHALLELTAPGDFWMEITSSK